MEFLEKLLPYLTTLVIGVIVYAINYVKQKSFQNELLSLKEYLKEADAKYYVICPNCGSKIGLSDVQIYQMAKEKQDGTELQ